ncbi:hypothetical protein [Agrobacterium sp. LMR679]|uniref:hypothetical protein n=1 Tax=Agrobacterium sp. LMR679 TaxID=3014335 RepID=UPI0022AF343F|nr:hypothetical protein [Agrobacterium sp. LMR679]MCZ4072824.1 hypothetical protein [Agrobacterium sp. LMR679]
MAMGSSSSVMLLPWKIVHAMPQTRKDHGLNTKKDSKMSERIQRLLNKPDGGLVDVLEGLISQVVTGIDEGRDTAGQIDDINKLSGGQDFVSGTFFKLYSWTSEREFAELAAMGPPPHVANMDQSDVVQCLYIIRSAEEPLASFCLSILQRSLPNVPITDIIFDRENDPDEAELAEEILSKAVAPNIICL